MIAGIPSVTTELRHTRNEVRECGSKVAYTSRAVAANAATALAWTGRDSLQGMAAYECSWCGDWHVGHPPGSRPSAA